MRRRLMRSKYISLPGRPGGWTLPATRASGSSYVACSRKAPRLVYTAVSAAVSRATAGVGVGGQSLYLNVHGATKFGTGTMTRHNELRRAQVLIEPEALLCRVDVPWCLIRRKLAETDAFSQIAVRIPSLTAALAIAIEDGPNR